MRWTASWCPDAFGIRHDMILMATTGFFLSTNREADEVGGRDIGGERDGRNLTSRSGRIDIVHLELIVFADPMTILMFIHVIEPGLGSCVP